MIVLLLTLLLQATPQEQMDEVLIEAVMGVNRLTNILLRMEEENLVSSAAMTGMSDNLFDATFNLQAAADINRDQFERRLPTMWRHLARAAARVDELPMLAGSYAIRSQDIRTDEEQVEGCPTFWGELLTLGTMDCPEYDVGIYERLEPVARVLSVSLTSAMVLAELHYGRSQEEIPIPFFPAPTGNDPPEPPEEL